MKKHLHYFFFVSSLTITVTIFMNCGLYAQSSIFPFKNESGKYGFKNETGIVIPAKYDTVNNFEDGLARVKLNNKWGYIDEKGKALIPIKFYWIEPAVFMGFEGYQEDEPTGWYRMKLNSKSDPWKYVDKTGKDLLFDNYRDLGYSEGMLEVASADKWGFADETGKLVIPMKYQDVESFEKGLAKVKLNNKWGLIDKTGKALTSLKYDTIALAYGKEHWYRFEMNKKIGLIDSLGNEVVHAKYDDIKYFTEGLAAFKLNDKWGYFDKKGEEIIPAQYEVAYTFTNGKANVKKDGKTLRIDNPLLSNKDQTSGSDSKANTPPVTLVKPPLPLKGKIDPTMIGLWKYTDAKSGRITYMKMNADGTSESYLNSVTPANKSKGFCYWLIDGNFYESVCDGYTSVNRYSFQKGYDKETGKPTLTLAGYIYVAADNKTSW